MVARSSNTNRAISVARPQGPGKALFLATPEVGQQCAALLILWLCTRPRCCKNHLCRQQTTNSFTHGSGDSLPTEPRWEASEPETSCKKKVVRINNKNVKKKRPASRDAKVSAMPVGARTSISHKYFWKSRVESTDRPRAALSRQRFQTETSETSALTVHA